MKIRNILKKITAIIFIISVVSTTVLSAKEGEQITLRLQPKKGDHFEEVINLSANAKMPNFFATDSEEDQQVLEANAFLNAKFTSEVNEISDNGDVTIQLGLDSFDLKAKIPENEPLAFSSQELNRQYPEAQELFSVAHMEMVLSPYGVLQDLKGFDDLLDKAFSIIPENDRGMTLEAFKKQFYSSIEEALKDKPRSGFDFYPEKPVSVGDTWNSKESQEVKEEVGGSQIIVKVDKESQWTFQDYINHMIYLNEDTTVTINLQFPPSKEMPFDGINVIVKVKGNIVIDENTGWPMQRSANLNTEVMGSMQGVKILMPIELTAELTTKSNKAA